jgi:hypothetical protein
MGKALNELIAYQRPTRSGVDIAGQAYVDDLVADGLIERAAKFVRTLGDTRVETELRTRAERFDTLVSSGSPLDQLRQAACDRVSTGFGQHERTLGDGLVWSVTPRRDAPDGGILRPSKVIIPNAQHVVECVDNIDRVRWSLADIVPTLGGFLGLNLEPPFPGLDDIRAFRDAVWTVWAAEKEDHVWGCFLLTQCGTAFGQGREAYQQVVAKIGRAQEQALKEAAGYLGSLMPRRKASADSDSAEDEEPQEQTSKSEDKAPKFFTPPQLAEEFGVDADKILGWIRSGQLVAVDMVATQGGRPRYRISAEEAQAFQKRRSSAPPPKSPPRTKPPKDDDTIKFY